MESFTWATRATEVLVKLGKHVIQNDYGKIRKPTTETRARRNGTKQQPKPEQDEIEQKNDTVPGNPTKQKTAIRNKVTI